jgi:metal-sulfur cluster biosynthetic enzyme
MTAASALPDADALRDALRGVDDPEAGMNIVDLGLVYAVESGAESVLIDLTMTSAACPMAEVIVDQVRDAIQAVTPPQTPIEVRLVWDPPWTPDKMTGIAKEHFGWPC